MSCASWSITSLLEALITLAIRVAGAGLAFALQALLARVMMPNEYGTFIMVWTWMLSLGSFASLGLAEVAMRLLPRYAARKRQRMLSGFFSHGFRTTAVTAGFFCLIGFGLSQVLPISQQSKFVLAGVCIGLPVLALEYFLEGVARAMGWFKLTTVTVYIIRPLMISTMVLAAWLLKFEVSAFLVCAILFVNIIVSTFGLRLVMYRLLKNPIRGEAPSRGTRRFWMKQSAPMLLASGIDDALIYADIVIVGLLLTAEQSAGYFVASRVLTLANLVQYAFFFVAARKFSLSLADGDDAMARNQMWRATLLTVVTTTAAVVFTILTAPYLLAIFGKNYSGNTSLVALLSLPLLARSAALQASELMMVDGRTKLLIAVNIMAILLTVFGLVAMIPLYGVDGAAWTLALVMLLRSVVLLTLQLQTKPSRLLAL
jgi:O-antigen/teichoic acid export membrane protein